MVQDVGDAESQLSAGHAASAGNAGAPIFVGRPRVEDDQLITALDARMQVVGVNLGDVMHHLNPLAKVLAGTLTPHSVGKLRNAQRLTPPVSVETSV